MKPKKPIHFPTVAKSYIAAERMRQVESKGYTPEKDDNYTNGELARAAASYASLAGVPNSFTSQWPWSGASFKPSHDKLRDLAKAGALLQAEIERVIRNGLAITELPVERDEYGSWTHPAWPGNEDEEQIPYSWFHERGLQISVVDFEFDAPKEISEPYYEQGDPELAAKWEPSRPEGEGWFVFSIHDNDDGPICVWIRPQRFADSEAEVAARAL